MMAAILCMAAVAAAKIQSSAAQEKRMIETAIRIIERWEARVPAGCASDPENAKAIDGYQRQFESHEAGILRDMNIAVDMARFCVCARQDLRLLAAINDLDSAAARLGADDQARYWGAKYQVHMSIAHDAQAPDSVRQWVRQAFTDRDKQVRLRPDINRIIDETATDIGKFDLSPPLSLDSAAIQWRRIAARVYVEKTKKLRPHGHKKAFEVARQAIRDLQPDQNLCAGGNTSCSPSDCARCYDQALVQPLCAAIGNDAQTLIEELCNRYEKNEYLLRILIPRLSRPTSGALAILRRVHTDDALKSDRGLAWIELTLWKKAKRLKEFKKQYPERYRLAVRAGKSAR
jgi:hypothetical protein